MSGISQANSRAGSVKIEQEAELSDGDLGSGVDWFDEMIREKESDTIATSKEPDTVATSREPNTVTATSKLKERLRASGSPTSRPPLKNDTSVDSPHTDNISQASDGHLESTFLQRKHFRDISDTHFVDF